MKTRVGMVFTPVGPGGPWKDFTADNPQR